MKRRAEDASQRESPDERAVLAKDAAATDPSVEVEPTLPWRKVAAEAGAGPSTFGDYELLDEIARGGMGVVYKARQISLHRLVAVKMVLAGQLASQAEQERFRAEAEAAAGLDHPGIVPVFEAGLHDGRLFYSMGFVDGRSLAVRLSEGPLQPLEAARLVAEVANAVQYAHERGVIHRDLKPGNILLDQQGRVRVTDFGLAKRVDAGSELTMSGQVLGTPSYMPPEQALAKQEAIGPTADVYALGALLYALVTGRPPFQAATPLETLRQAIEAPPAPLRQLNRSLPRDLETIVLKCLEKSPSQRYPTARDLVAELQRFLGGEPIQARPIGNVERLWRWAKRRPAAAALIAVSVIFLVILVAGGGVYRSIALDRQNAVQAQSMVEGLLASEIEQAPRIVEQLGAYRAWADPMLRNVLKQNDLGDRERLRASLGMLAVDLTQAEYLTERLLDATPSEAAILCEMLGADMPQVPDRLWVQLQDTSLPKAQRLRTACLLAQVDPENAAWENAAPELAAELVRANVADMPVWSKLLRPVRKHITKTLADILRNDQYTDLEHLLSAQILSDYAADQPQLLAELCLTAGAAEFNTLLPRLEGNPAAITVFEDELHRALFPEWPDKPLDGARNSVDPATLEQVQRAEGVVAERFAYCQTLPLDEFSTLADSLGQAGYRPVRLRPYWDGNIIRVAAVWKRDGRAWQVALGLTSDEMREKDGALMAADFTAVDLAGYLAAGEGLPQMRYAAVWVADAAVEHRESQIIIGVNPAEHQVEQQRFAQSGFAMATLQDALDQNGTPALSSTWTKSPDANGNWSAWDLVAGNFDKDSPAMGIQVDVGLRSTVPALNMEDLFTYRLEESLSQLNTDPSDASWRHAKAIACFNLHRDQESLDELSWLIDKGEFVESALGLRTVLLARMGRADQAGNDLARLKELATTGLHVDRAMAWLCNLEAIVTASGGSDEEAVRQLEIALAENASDPDYLLESAAALATIAEMVAGDASKSERYVKRAFELLQKQIDDDTTNPAFLQSHGRFEFLRKQPAYAEMLRRAAWDRQYAAVWRAEAGWESLELRDLELPDHAARCRELMERGYRPAAIAVCRRGQSGPLAASSVWHLPIVTDDQKDLHAQRQANAAIGLLRCSRPEVVWPLLRHSPEPALRTWLIHRLAPLGIDAKVLATQLENERDLAARQAILLALGEYNKESLSREERSDEIEKSLELYREDPDPGVHSAAEWLLRRLGAEEKLGEVHDSLRIKEAQFQDRRPDDPRRWYISQEGQTLVLVRGPLTFTMGAPADNPSDEFLRAHTRVIERSFAIASRETTNSQYIRFEQETNRFERPNTRVFSPDANGPAIFVSWYAAAAYCNWLSAREGIPADQWCYLPNDANQFAEGMRTAPDYLSLCGYRLPTEAEWEAACRAGTTSAYYYGSAPQLLKDYAWHQKIAEDQAWPTGSLRPNLWGVFDMLGNACEWCDTATSIYPVGRGDDRHPSGSILENETRVIRGGAFNYRDTFLGSSLRDNRPPATPAWLGFRVARTLESFAPQGD